MIIDVLVEGPTDEIVAKKLVMNSGHEFGIAFGKKGHNYLQNKISGFNVRARFGNPILLLVDFMDTKLDCPPDVITSWLPDRCDKLFFRVVIRELESWLLADREGIANFLSISKDVVPQNPEALHDPKQELINLARRSRRKIRREEIVPQANVSSVVGPGYVAAIEEFVEEYWNIEAAMERAPSLMKCILRIGEIE
ncbi:hypothetical protein JW960_00985 [candidate division KSB1 bacterium]|nr:hypothetical protein [candidate division KSB1 bacterium]